MYCAMNQINIVSNYKWDIITNGNNYKYKLNLLLFTKYTILYLYLPKIFQIKKKDRNNENQGSNQFFGPMLI